VALFYNKRFIESEDLPLVIRHGASNAIHILNKYYARTDLSEIYRIAMGASSHIHCMFYYLNRSILSLASAVQTSVFRGQVLATRLDRYRKTDGEGLGEELQAAGRSIRVHVDINRQVNEYIFR
jgi:hypothetical protein